MSWRVGGLAVAAVSALGGCGGGGGDGGTPNALKKTHVVPHVFEQKGTIRSVATGDFTGDGVPDLAVLDATTASVTLLASTALRESPTRPSQKGRPLMRRGYDAYKSGSSVLVWNGTRDLCPADIDGDGRVDLVAASGDAGAVGLWSSEVTTAGALRYHEWRWRGSVAVADACDRVTAGDVNGDGHCDLVTLDETTGQAHVLLQDPASPFSFVVGNDPPALGACRGLVLADFDRDGDLDLLTNRDVADALALLAQGGAAGWTLRESPTRQSTGRAMAVGDVDGDGWLDAVVLAEGGTSAVSMRGRSDGSGLFDDAESPLGATASEDGEPVCQLSIDEPGTPRAGIAIDEEGVQRLPRAAGHAGSPGSQRCVCQNGLVLADMDRDGQLDLVLSPPIGDPDFDLLVAYGIRESPTRFSLTEPLAARFRESPSRPSLGRLCATGDLDQDGHVDLVMGDPDFDLLRLSYSEAGTPPPAPAYSERLRIVPTAQTTGRGIADVDRDGHPDIVRSTTAGVQVHFQDAAAPGTLGQPLVIAAAQSFVDVAVGDVNGDGCPDCVACTAGACVTLLRDPLKPREFLPAIPFPPLPGSNFRSLALGDVDGDGFPDCVAIRESPSKASLGRGMGNGFFDVFTELDCAVQSPRQAALADLDCDGRLDMVVCGDDACAVVLQDSVVPGKFLPPQTLGHMRGVRVAVGDLNGDGAPDVIVSGADGVAVALQSQLAPGAFEPAYALSTEVCGGLAVGDVDRDGALDVCFVETVAGTLVCSGGDPDFDLLRVISLHGLPPGVPFDTLALALADLDGDGKAVCLVTCPSGAGLATGAIVIVADVP